MCDYSSRYYHGMHSNVAALLAKHSIYKLHAGTQDPRLVMRFTPNPRSASPTLFNLKIQCAQF